MNARTSDRVSSIAAELIKLDETRLLALTATQASREVLITKIRSVCATALVQDEHRGLRGLVRKVIGR